MTRFGRWTHTLLCTCLLVLPRAVCAQGEPARRDSVPLRTRSDAHAAGALVAASAILFTADERIAHWMQRPALQRKRSLDRTATTFEWIGGPGAFVLPATALVLGKLGHDRRTTDVALHTGTSVLLAAGLTQAIKRTIGRARPYVVHDSDAFDVKFGRGFTRGEAYRSFPSGHATAAFATATALVAESQRWWPKRTRVIAPIAYGAATLVGVGRVFHDKHWASDVVMGAAVGTLTARTVVRWQHAHPRNTIDRLLGAGTTSVSAVPAPGGTMIAITLPFPRYARRLFP